MASRSQGTPPRATAAFTLALLMAAFIVYGSLYPFRFRPLPEGVTLPGLLALAWGRGTPGRGDLAANLLLYAPLGFALALGLAARLRGWAAVLLGMLACGLLSAAMEFGQFHVPGRTPSVWDFALNSLGGAVGALAGALLAPRRAGSLTAWRLQIAEGYPALLLGCWLAYRFYPYVPALDLGEWRASLRPLLAPFEPDALRVLRLALLWLVAARLLDAARPRGEAGLLFGALLLASLGGAVLLVGRQVTHEEILAAALALPGWLLLRRLPRPDLLLLPAMLLAILLVGAAPYRLLEAPRAFGWIPLHSVMSGHWGNGLQAMLLKFYLYGGLAWLGLRAGLRLPLAGGLAVLVAIAVSLLQTWLPGRSGEITDALLAAGAVLTLHLLRRPPGRVRAAAAA